MNCSDILRLFADQQCSETIRAHAMGLGINRPITAATIRQARGIIAAKPGQKSLAGEWAEHKREETRLEDK